MCDWGLERLRFKKLFGQQQEAGDDLLVTRMIPIMAGLSSEMAIALQSVVKCLFKFCRECDAADCWVAARHCWAPSSLVSRNHQGSEKNNSS
jgi:hypothetical protein